MQTTIAVTAAAGALLFGGAAVNAPVPHGPAPASTTTSSAPRDAGTHHSDTIGLCGLAGAVGLTGLAGLTRRRNHTREAKHSAPHTTG